MNLFILPVCTQGAVTQVAALIQLNQAAVAPVTLANQAVAAMAYQVSPTNLVDVAPATLANSLPVDGEVVEVNLKAAVARAEVNNLDPHAGYVLEQVSLRALMITPPNTAHMPN